MIPLDRIPTSDLMAAYHNVLGQADEATVRYRGRPLPVMVMDAQSFAFHQTFTGIRMELQRRGFPQHTGTTVDGAMRFS